MKFRIGFVSNSSTTSFCIYGVRLEHDIIKTLLEDKNIDSENEEYVDVAEKLFGKEELFYRYDYDGNDIYVGKELSSMKDNETFGEFKKSIEEKLKSIGINEECSIIEEAWYDG